MNPKGSPVACLGRSILLAAAAALSSMAQPAICQEVVALRIDAGRPRDDSIEKHFVGCIASAFSPPPALGHDQPSAALRNALFPWLDPGVAPATAEAFSELLDRPMVRERLRALGVHFVVTLVGGEQGHEPTDAMLWLPGAGGFWGVSQEVTKYSLAVSVWDVRSRTLVGSSQAGWSRTIGAVGLWLPVPYYHSTASAACDEVVKLIRTAAVLAK